MKNTSNRINSRSSIKTWTCKLFNMSLLLLFFLQISLPMAAADKNPQPITISIRLTNVSLKDAVKELSAKSGYHFFYNDGDFDMNRKVSINVVKKDLLEVLETLFPKSKVTVKGKQIILSSAGKKTEYQSSIQTKVHGYVSNEAGEPVLGATILLLGTSNATTSDDNGRFSIDVKKTGAQLRVSYINCLEQIITITDFEDLAVTLVESNKALDEVVVIGYGTQKRVNMTGAVSTISNEKIVQSNRPDMTSALAGKLSGVRTIQTSGRPGADGSYIDIRGYGAPLTIVDGVERPFSQIDPNEVESVSVLKDASASVYGFKGSNGVVLITTKKGKEGTAKIDYNFNYGMQSITRYPQYMDGVDYAKYTNEGRLNLGQTAQFSNEEIDRIANSTDPVYSNTNWNKAVLNDFAPMAQHNLNISGGSAKTQYFASLGFLNQDGILKTKDNYQRYNFRSNLKTVLVDNLTADVQIGGRRELRDGPAQAGDGGDFVFGVFKALASAYPIYPTYANKDVNHYAFLQSGMYNPVALIDRDKVGYNKSIFEEFNAQLALNYDFPQLKGLSAKALLAFDKQLSTSKSFKKAWSVYQYEALTNSYREFALKNLSNLDERFAQNNISNQQYSLNYAHKFGKNDLSALGLWEIRQIQHNEFYAGREFTISALDEMSAGNQTNKTNGGSSYKSTYMGFVGRLNYSYDTKYLMELSCRYDGSYKFTSDSRWGFFPSVSAGWRISEERFMKEYASFFDNLKLRASFGEVGDDSGANPDNFLNGYVYPSWTYVMGTDNVVNGASDKGLNNMNLTWYKVTLADVGLDASLWNNKLNVEFDYFYRKRTGLLATRILTLPSSFGASLPQENLNSGDNRGFELTLGTNQRVGEFRFNISGNMSYSRAKNLYQERAESANAYLNWRENGMNRWTNLGWGYQALGQFNSYEEILSSPIQDTQGNLTLLPGDIKYKDLNGDGIISDLDQSVIGRSTYPDVFFGLNLNTTWRNFDMTIFFQGASNYSYNFNYKSAFVQGGMGNGYTIHQDRWHRSDVNDMSSEWVAGRYPAIRVNGYDGNNRTSTFWQYNATYLRLKTLELGYTLPKSLTKKVSVEKLRFYVNAYNLLTFASDKMKYVDPEGESNYGFYYPQMKTENVGVNVEF